MRLSYLTTAMARGVMAASVMMGSALAASSSGTVALNGFVRGHTTIAEAEQGLGAPAGTIVRADGALSLVYPVARFAERMPASLPGAGRAGQQSVTLRFAHDFTYQQASFAGTGDTKSLGLASR